MVKRKTGRGKKEIVSVVERIKARKKALTMAEEERIRKAAVVRREKTLELFRVIERYPKKGVTVLGLESKKVSLMDRKKQGQYADVMIELVSSKAALDVLDIDPAVRALVAERISERRRAKEIALETIKPLEPGMTKPVLSAWIRDVNREIQVLLGEDYKSFKSYEKRLKSGLEKSKKTFLGK